MKLLNTPIMLKTKVYYPTTQFVSLKEVENIFFILVAHLYNMIDK